MTSSIQIQFQQAKFTSTSASITVGNGTIVVTANQSISFGATIPFETLTISNSSVSFRNNALPDVTVYGTVGIPISSAASGSPTITVNGFSGSITVTWPSNTGGQTQTIVPGDPITLNGFAG